MAEVSIPVSSALRRRTLTALSLMPLVILSTLWLATPAFAFLFSLPLFLAAWEWCALAGVVARSARILYLIVVAVGMVLVWLSPDWQFILFGASALWWVAQGVRLVRVRRIELVPGPQIALLPIGLLVLVTPWAALIHLHRMPDVGPVLVLFLLFLIWTADSMAFFVGRRWGQGRARLAPAVSPGKTRVGVYGAMAGAVVCGLVFAWMWSFDFQETLLLLLVCGLSALISVVGDLYESLLKRRCGVKDSGQLLPGHGGLLDRIDSLTAAAPVFALGITLIGVGS